MRVLGARGRTRRVLVGLLLGSCALGGVARAQDERATLARLEERSRAFYEVLERGDRERATALWTSLAADLGAFADKLENQLDAMREEVTERDGDLEELYKSPRWRDPEIASLVVTYHLAWVRYQGAQLTSDAAKKKTLLRQAADGFSQFVVVNEVPEIYADSLYGRGLAFLDLGEYGKAIEDLSTAADQPRVAGKARAALEEARRRQSGGKERVADDPEALLTKLGEMLPRAAAGDPAVEKETTALARGLAARGGTWPARVREVVTTKLGGDGGVSSSYGLLLLGQLAVDRGRCDDVTPLLAAGSTVRDAARNRLRPELLFLAAGCRLNGGHPREAADGFATLLSEFPDSSRAPEAAYYRFRALAVARADDAGLTPAYEESLRTYLTRYPRAEGAAEAHYLLGELYRGRPDCAAAAPEYAAVTAGPFAARARLGTLECRVATLDKTSDAATRREVVDGLRAFVRDTPAKGDDEARVARAALMAALVAGGGPAPDQRTVIELLDGFETRYPNAKDLGARALEQRLAARGAVGDLAGASRDLDAYLVVAKGDPDARRTLTRLGRDLMASAERVPPEQKPQALALARRVYGALAESGVPADRLTLADLDLRAGDAAAARRTYEAVLATEPTSAEAIRGAARAAAAQGDREAALGYWRRALEASTPGGTGWYEARIAQVELLAASGRASDACALVRSSVGRATSAGADQLEGRLRGMAAQVCK